LAVTIRRLKYGSRPDLAGALAEVVRRAVRATGLDVDVIVPVPLHRARRIERGYNQSALLASRIAREVGARVAYRALRRSTRTGPQVGLDRAARLANVRAAFVVRAPAEIDGRRILLVDDVCTTGATLAACAEALRAAGAREVVAIVVARALTDEDASPVAPSTNGL
jgi:ComF family protein